MAKDTNGNSKSGDIKQVVIFRSLREVPFRVLDYYIVDDDAAWDCFKHLCNETGMEKCRYMDASAEAILATITEPPSYMQFNQAVEILNDELANAAQCNDGRTAFGFIRKVDLYADAD